MQIGFTIMPMASFKYMKQMMLVDAQIHSRRPNSSNRTPQDIVAPKWRKLGHDSL